MNNYEADEISPDDLQAASEMYISLMAGTFYSDHEAAVAALIAEHAPNARITP